MNDSREDNIRLSINSKERARTKKKKVVHRLLEKDIKIRKATIEDLEDIFDVAASVGGSKKEAHGGFLMDNYASNPSKHKKVFRNRLDRLNYFYVAELKNIPVGFLMAYTKEEWLENNPNWIKDISWTPRFNINEIEKFVLTEKVAIDSKFTGKGIGSLVYGRYMKDLKKDGIHDIFSETVISPTPNYASLAFRKKQKFTLVGTRFEDHDGKTFTDLVYHKRIK